MGREEMRRAELATGRYGYGDSLSCWLGGRDFIAPVTQRKLGYLAGQTTGDTQGYPSFRWDDGWGRRSTQSLREIGERDLGLRPRTQRL